MRRHKRYRLDASSVNGQISMADKVELLDFSLGGISLKVDRRLNIGREYLLKLWENGKSLDVKCIVVRAELSGIEQLASGESVSIYTAGMTFKEGSAARIAEFFKPMTQHKLMTIPDPTDRRLNVRFNIGGPMETILNDPAHFTVKTISQSGLLIRTEQALAIESRIPITLSLNADNPVQFNARVATCQMINDQGNIHYDLGMEFTDMTEQNISLLKTFIDFLAETDEKNL